MQESLYDELRAFLLNPDRGFNISADNYYTNFPIYKGLDDEVVIAPCVVLSPQNGVLVFEVCDATKRTVFEGLYPSLYAKLDNLYTQIHTRLIRNPLLKKSRSDILINITTLILAPFIEDVENSELKDDIVILYSYAQLEKFLKSNQSFIEDKLFKEAASTIEGAKGIIPRVVREIPDHNTRGYAANEVDSEIARFDQKQKALFLQSITGLSRIRGLAGSGKTVILCMKAALLHLEHPEKTVLYTFYTKSLYQHVQRLITRFYRQFNDQDPNWDQLLVRHAWGNYSADGVYRDACIQNGVNILSYDEAKKKNPKMPFDAACQSFLNSVEMPVKQYDYVLIDEGQDFPKSFIRMCRKLVREDKLIYAYDDLQTIFQNEVPSASEIFGPDSTEGSQQKFSQDIILYKCYRNPREILLVAHAIGFGIYSNIVQMIEDEKNWQDLGYIIKEGELKEGQRVVITRPKENSLESVSSSYKIDEIITGNTYEKLKEEVDAVCDRIENDIINEHLRPEDILVITMDDRYASLYLNSISSYLAEKGILCNNIHADKYSVKDFHIKDRVTLSTIHKAKGNEAFSVYIVGIDALLRTRYNVRERNLLFTAMTRSKGWVSLTGMGVNATEWIEEIEQAKSFFPNLEFIYPGPEHLRTMKLDLEQANEVDNRDLRMLDKILERMTQEEINRYIDQKKIDKHI